MRRSDGSYGQTEKVGSVIALFGFGITGKVAGDAVLGGTMRLLT